MATVENKKALQAALKEAGALAKKDPLTSACMGVLIADKVFPGALPPRTSEGARTQCPGFAVFCDTMKRVIDTPAQSQSPAKRPAPTRT